MTKKNQPPPTIPKDCYYVDTHCHLDMPAFAEDFDQILLNASKNNVRKIISIGIDLKSSKAAIEIARTKKHVFSTIGIHPHDIDNVEDSTYASLQKLFSQYSDHIVGYGEIGLDYFKNYSDPANQRKHFTKQLNLAHDLELPVIIHNRQSDDDTLKILRDAKPFTHGGILHCFSGDYEFACKIMDLGLLISIPGVVTFKNATTLHDVVKKVPLTSLVLETDGPFLSPHPFRGKRNEPAYIPYIAEKIAQIQGISIKQVANQTTANAENLFSALAV